MRNIKIAEIERVLKLAIIQKNKIKINNSEVELRMAKNKIELSKEEEFIGSEKENILEFNYEDSIYNLKCKVSSKKREIEVIELVSKEKNNNRLIKVNDYAVLIIDERTKVNVNIEDMSNEQVFFKILKKDEDLVFNNLDKKLNIIMNYNNENIEIEVVPKIENLSKTENTLIYSEIKIKSSVNVFSEYIEEKTSIQNKNEKSKLINNLIKEMY